MKTDDRKVIQFNLKILKFVRLYGVADRTLGWILAFLCFLNNILQLTDIIHNYKYKTIDGLVIQVFLWVCAFNFNHRFKIFLFKNKEIDIVIEFMNDIWDKTETHNEPFEMAILMNCLNRGSKIIIFNLTSTFVGVILASCYPFIIGVRETPYEWYIPGIDFHKSPLYDILFVYQSFIVIPGLSSVNITYANLVVTWLLFGLVAFQLLQKKVRLVSLQETESDSLEALHDCIRLHNRIIEYIRVIKEIISPVSFVEITLLSIMLCFLMFYALYVSYFMVCK